MEIVYYCFRWLLWTILISLLQHYQEVTGSPRACPRGQIIHIHKSPYRVMCCYPTRCGVGEQVKPCTINGTQDSCQICSAYQNQSLRTSSFTMENCTDWLLDKNCMNVNNPGSRNGDDQMKRCMCNLEQGKKYNPPELIYPDAPIESYCQRIKDPCQAGYEPHVDGDCRPCKDTHFKSLEGFSLCEPKTNCALLGLEYTFLSDTTADDNQCSKPDPIITTKPIKPITPGKPDATTAPSQITVPVSSPASTTSWGTTWSENIVHFGTTRSSKSRQVDEDADIMWPVIFSVISIVVLAVSIGLVIFCCRRRGMSICTCAKFRNCVDPEGNHSQGSMYEPRVRQMKHQSGNGCLRNGSKIVINHGNGGVPSSIEDLPNGHTNGNIPHHPIDHSDMLQYTNSLYSHSAIPRPDILRFASRRVVFGQRPGMSLDIIDQEQLQVCVNGFDANPNLGETDFLLVPGHSQGAGALMQTGVSSEHMGLNGCRTKNFGQMHLQNNPFLQSVPQQGSTAIYIPAADEVKFTRSVSLIASPEGEVDEEAKCPRFSLLLQEGDDSSFTDTSNDTRVMSPPDHVHNHHQVVQAPRPQKLAGHLPDLTESAVQNVLQTDQPDHQIMNLKKQELSDSIESSSNSYTLPKMTADLTLTSAHAPVTFDEAQQTKLKTLRCPTTDKFSDTSPSANTSPPLLGGDTFDDLELKQSCLAERNRHKIDGVRHITKGNKSVKGENSSHGFSDRTFVLSGDSKNNHEQNHTPSDLQRLCLKSSIEEGETTNGEPHQCNNEATSEEVENLWTGSKQRGPTADPWQPVRSQNSAEKVSTSSKRGPLRSVSDSEQASAAQGFPDIDDSDWKCVPQVSNSSSKMSVNSDFSSTDNSTCSLGKSTKYRRSQSHNAAHSTESSHKLPPRSMSEEKPQKLDRPVAKVKPMPASDTSVNQLPDDTSVMPQVTAPAAAAASVNTAAAATLDGSSSSDESDQECDMEESFSST